MESNFCSNLSKKSGEPLAGSAPHAKYFIFISWPKKNWGYEALDSLEGLPKELKNWMHINSQIHGKISIRLASRKKIKSEKTNIFIYPGKFSYLNVSPTKITEILDQHFNKSFKSSNYAKKINIDQIFVCTHGRHDKCCAKYGQKIAELMRAHVEKKNLNIEIWDSSHLGGHRFAPTFIDFPNGYSYGRLEPKEIHDFFSYRKKNKIYIPAYRGSVFLKDLEKTAEANIYHYCHYKKLDRNLEIKKIEKIDDGKFNCIVNLSPNKFDVKLGVNIPDIFSFSFVLKEYENPPGCDSLDERTKRKCWEMQQPVKI